MYLTSNLLFEIYHTGPVIRAEYNDMTSEPILNQGVRCLQLQICFLKYTTPEREKIFNFIAL